MRFARQFVCRGEIENRGQDNLLPVFRLGTAAFADPCQASCDIGLMRANLPEADLPEEDPFRVAA